MVQQRNIRLEGKHGKPIMVDIYYVADGQPKPVIIFSHGFKGFKDWGHFDLLAQEMATRGFVYVKFNFSHNGTTPEQLTDFADLDAFGNNTITKELDDLGTVIDFISSHQEFKESDNAYIDELYLMGHSKGGGVTLLKASEDNRVKKVLTLASVNTYKNYWPADVMEKWKKDGVIYIYNSRTHQDMPVYYSTYEDYCANENKLDVQKAVENLDIPVMFIHGTDDPTVPFAKAEELHSWNPQSELVAISDGNHVFGGKHPYEMDVLPGDTLTVVEKATEFFSRQ